MLPNIRSINITYAHEHTTVTVAMAGAHNATIIVPVEALHEDECFVAGPEAVWRDRLARLALNVVKACVDEEHAE